MHNVQQEILFFLILLEKLHKILKLIVVDTVPGKNVLLSNTVVVLELS